jgi:hypothetical protein
MLRPSRGMIPGGNDKKPIQNEEMPRGVVNGAASIINFRGEKLKGGMTKMKERRTVVRHCVECGARAAAISLSWGDVLRPDAAFAWLTIGRDAADHALECDQVHEDEGEVPAQQAEEEGAIKEPRVRAATDAAEGGEDEDHG